MKLRVLLLEDDHMQREDIRQALIQELGAQVETKTTESECRNDFDVIAANPPDVAVLDVMVRWAGPSRNMPVAPDEVTRNPEQAGLRCARLLREATSTKAVKIILYSVLPKEEIGEDELPGTAYLVKEPDWQNLLDAVKEVSATLMFGQN
jgi:DNA-binding NarL/FixJ family response regulator